METGVPHEILEESREITNKIFLVLEKRMDLLCEGLERHQDFSVRMSVVVSLMLTMVANHISKDHMMEMIEQVCVVIKSSPEKYIEQMQEQDIARNAQKSTKRTK